MDPIMKATKSFLVEMDALWKRGPGPALRMVAEADDRGAVIKALRLAELSRENKRPLFLHEAPFVEQSAYFAGLAEAKRFPDCCCSSGAAGLAAGLAHVSGGRAPASEFAAMDGGHLRKPGGRTGPP